jgi:cardiolipin synthase
VPEARDARVLTVPNVISVGRLCCVPWFLWLLFHDHDRRSASILLAVLGATDWVDGWIARRFDQGSTLGKIIDPVADRILLGVGVLAIIIDHSVPWWVGALTVLREVLVSAAVLVLAALGAKRIDVTWWGKTGTFLMMFAYPLFLAHHATFSWHRGAGVLAWVFVAPALLISYYAAWAYVPLARTALRDGRAARSQRPVS